MTRSPLAIMWTPLLLLTLSANAGRGEDPQQHVLRAAPKPGAVQRVHLVAEADGNVRMKAPRLGKTAAERAAQAQTTDQDTERALALSARGELKYDEKLLANGGPRQRQSIRYYRQAEATVGLAEGKLEPTLQDDRHWIVAQISEAGTVLVCPFGPLAQSELDLVQPPLNSLAADLVLPSQPKAVEEQWQLNDVALASLFDLDVVTQSNVTARLKKVDEQLAVIEFSGRLNAALRGVATEIDVVGKANFNFAQQCVTWLAVSFDERRAIGHGQPGVTARNRVRMAIQPLEETPTELSPSTFADIPLGTGPEMQLLRTQSALGGFRLLHPRTWRVMLERQDVMILRLVQQNDFVAQCNISPLDRLPDDRRVSLEGFQAEVLKSLRQFNPQVTGAEETSNAAGLQILRIAVSGMISEVPVHWIYYHAANAEGQRASYVFTIQDKMLERFGAADAGLTETLELTPRDDKTTVPPSVSRNTVPSQQK